jgi:hypothetical protein
MWNPDHSFFRLSFLCRPRTVWRERVRIQADLYVAQLCCRLYEARAKA